MSIPSSRVKNPKKKLPYLDPSGRCFCLAQKNMLDITTWTTRILEIDRVESVKQTTCSHRNLSWFFSPLHTRVKLLLQMRVHFYFPNNKLYMHCILIFIQYYHMFWLSTSAIIRQDTGSKDSKTGEASPGTLWLENTRNCKIYNYYYGNWIISDIKINTWIMLAAIHSRNM
jgi:hypothetical protein